MGSPLEGLSRFCVASIELARFFDGLVAERHVHGHLVAVEVGVEGRSR